MKSKEELFNLLEEIYSDESKEYMQVQKEYDDHLDVLLKDIHKLHVKITTLKFKLRDIDDEGFTDLHEEITKLENYYKWKYVPLR